MNIKHFNDLGGNGISPNEYKKIRVHPIYDIKCDTRRKVRCIADGHLTKISLDSVYSGVVSLR